MGRKRKYNKAKTAKKTISADILGGILVVIGLVLLVFLSVENIGILPHTINIVLKGLFSKVSYAFPIIIIYIGIYAIVSDKKIKISNEILKGIIVMSVISTLIFIFSENTTNFFNNSVKFVTDTYNSAIISGNIYGLIGAIIGSIFLKVVGSLASKIILVFLSVITLLYFFKITVRQLFVALYNAFAFIVNSIYKIYYEVFLRDRKEEYEISDIKKYDEDGNGKLSRKERKKLMQEKIKEEKLKEMGSLNVENNLKTNTPDQVEFDFSKIGGNLSKEAEVAKQQRDEFFKKEREQKEDKSIKEVLTLDHTKLYEEQNYIFPSVELLGNIKIGNKGVDKRAIGAIANKLEKTLDSFGVKAKVTHITKGPTVTRYELSPSVGVKVSKIVNLADDIALNLAAKSIRIEAPIPGKAAVGIEVPNPVLESVALREVIESNEFKEHPSNVCFSLGKDAAGDIKIGDIAKMPHVLIAGATGSGKSVCINSMIVSMLYKSKPSDVKLMLIDPKMVELSGYNGIPHLLIPVVTDPKKAAGALNWAVQEMVRRYNLFASHGVKDIKGYNKVIKDDEEGVKLPQIVIIIDELADLMMVAPNDVEDAICRLAQMARAAGMHLVVATQRPSVDVITGIIKANIPSRIAFTVSSQVDSRTILDMAGAEKLLGKGDMLYFPVGETKPLRIQGAFVSENEIEKIVEDIKANNTQATYSDDIIESIEKAGKEKEEGKNDNPQDEADELLEDAIDLVVDMGQASASMLQRRFKIGYSRAGRLIDQMEVRGLISGYEGSKPRKVLISKYEWQELKMSNNNIDEKNIVKDNNNINEEDNNIKQNIEIVKEEGKKEEENGN